MLKATELDGTKTDAYLKYIEKSTDAGKLLSCKTKDSEDKEDTYDINTFSKEFGENQDKLKLSGDYDKLCFETGYAIFNLYQSDSGSKLEAAFEC